MSDEPMDDVSLTDDTENTKLKHKAEDAESTSQQSNGHVDEPSSPSEKSDTADKEQTHGNDDTIKEEVTHTAEENDVASGAGAPETTLDSRTGSLNNSSTTEFPTLSNSSTAPSSVPVTVNDNSSEQTQSPKIRRSRRAPSLALSIGSTSSGKQTISASVFIKKAMETIKNSKDARKISALETSVSKACKEFESEPNALPSPITVFEPLKIVCMQSHNTDLKVIALDCIGKLFTFSYLEDPPAPTIEPGSDIRPPPTAPLVEQAVSTVCDSYTGEGTNPKVELQVIKALMAAVLNEDMVIHGATLLKALRQTYNIFVLSHSPTNQAIAQAALNQVVNVVFERVKSSVNEKSENGSSVLLSESGRVGSVSEVTAPEITLKQMERRKSFDYDEGNDDGSISDIDLSIKDAFLVFRTMCKLSEKNLDSEGFDLKSHGMRSKLLSLHLVHTILKTHMSIFTNDNIVVKSNRGDEKFVPSIKDYVCSSLARNAASISPAVFEISAEIFWLILSNLRSQFKKELEVFFSEIYFPILEMRNSTNHQKRYLLSIIQRICNDPRALVEIYLNYDCDSKSSVNIYEKIIDILVKMAVVPVHISSLNLQQYHEYKHKPIAVYNLSLPPALSISNVTQHNSHPDILPFPAEYGLKMSSLESLVAVLRSLLAWSQRSMAAVAEPLESGGNDSSANLEESEENLAATDDPSQFETLKQRKSALSEAIREFNFKPKRGLERLISGGFIKSREPAEVAEFLGTTEGLDKATIGEFLGEGDPYNVSIMHEFIDRMEFTNTHLVEALRVFLQSFRLPGEGQKIDRFMLKFAERYISGNPGSFANAEAAYVLAYATIMLNTDLHSKQIKNRMTLDEFISMNRGINDKKDLPREYLSGIYDEIQNNEIKLLSEQHAALLSSTATQQNGGVGSSFGLSLVNAGRDVQREAYMQASREMSNKTENMFKSLLISNKGKGNANGSTDSLTSPGYIFYVASHVEHVKPMFEVCWMSLLAGLSGPFQESEEPEVIALCLEGLRLSIRIACLFDLEYPRISFVSALAKFTNLQNLSEMKSKNVEAVKVLLATALSEGNMLKSSWKNVLVSVSQLERFQLISAGISAGTLPDVNQARIESRNSTESSRTGGLFGLGGFGSHNNSVALSQAQIDQFTPEFGEEMRSREVVVYMDRIFTESAHLNGSAIQDFVKALIEVSWQEIQSSGTSEHPRLFSLQKMVDVCYYNMDRIRVEWSQLWAIMGDQIKKMGCHENTSIVTFALDSLRQLSIRFFDLDELPHFQFQKDFLAPFEYVMKNNKDIGAKDMTLQCLRQMILAKGDRIKSGWSAIFATFGAAGKSEYLSIASSAFELTRLVYDDYLEKVVAQDGFADMISCLGEVAKNPRFQKTSLQALEILNSRIGWLDTDEVRSRLALYSDESKDEFVNFHDKYWLPVFASLHDVIMNGEDLEVRSRALNYLFDNLVEYGGDFEPEFWDKVCRQLLFPIFVVLKSRSTSNLQDNISVWLSTTMIQALRNMIAMLTHYFDTLERMLEGFLDLLIMCIDQDNDTVSRIGSSCLLTLVSNNATRFSADHWHLIVDKVDGLFITSTAEELFDDSLSGANAPANGTSTKTKGHLHSQSSIGVHQQLEDESKSHLFRFRGAIMKSILQLLMIETAGEMMSNEIIFNAMPTEEILRIAESLRQSYLFAKKFNSDRDLRRSLWRQGFMKQMPNLHKQESTAAVTYVTVIMNVYKSTTKQGLSDKEKTEIIENQLLTLCIDVVQEYNSLDAGDRHSANLEPVVVTIMQEYSNLDDADFHLTIKSLYGEVIDLLKKEVSPSLREAMHTVLGRVGAMINKQ